MTTKRGRHELCLDCRGLPGSGMSFGGFSFRTGRGWRTAKAVWENRTPLLTDRTELRDQVEHRQERLRRHDAIRNEAEDVVARFAIERELTKRGFMSHSLGGWCQRIGDSRNAHQSWRIPSGNWAHGERPASMKLTSP